jgi:nucleotide-binding universal stress UspA family protein
MTTPQIIVGVDGSPGAVAATRWAATEAVRTGSELLVIHVYDWRVIGAKAPIGGAYADDARARAGELVESAVADAQAHAPEVQVRGEALLGSVVPTLVSASSDATLVVLGSRGRGGFASLLLGSVSQQVATHAASPVVIVRGRPGDIDGPVVVGTDGSDSAHHAVGTAFEAAARRGTSVVAVRAYTPVQPPWGPYVAPYVEDREARKAAEQEALEADVKPWAEKYPDVAVETVVVDRPAAEVLIGISSTAQLVIVGTRGHGGFTGVLVGSVGLHLLHHAESPVFVDRAPTTS